jgi:hypothetical protein
MDDCDTAVKASLLTIENTQHARVISQRRQPKPRSPLVNVGRVLERLHLHVIAESGELGTKPLLLTFSKKHAIC